MKSSDAPSYIEGISVSKVELTLGGAGDVSLKVRANLVSKKGDIHGATEKVGGWSSYVTNALAELVSALEDDLLSTHFDTGEENDNRDHKFERPTGILGTKLGRS